MARKNENPKVPGCHGFAVFNDRHEPHWTGKVELIPEMLDIPLRRRKPTTYFVNSMSDLFHESLPDEAIDRVFVVMALCPQHTFQVLTKRADRMRGWFQRLQKMADAWAPHTKRGEFTPADVLNFRHMHSTFGHGPAFPNHPWPFPNVWLGVSVEDQQHADERIPLLLQTPAAVRFLSVEPLLGPVDLTTIPNAHSFGEGQRWYHALKGYAWESDGADYYDVCNCEPKLDWVIVGGESGRDARPMHPDWARSIRDQCVAAGVPFFFKQWGEHGIVGKYEGADVLHRVGKKRAGRLLDGREWNEMPAVRNA